MIVSIVIPSRNGRAFLARCLPALAVTALPPGWALEAIVVDNGSAPDDGTPACLAPFSFARLVRRPRPLGFAAANAAARGLARGEVIAFLNNDTEPEPGWLLRPLSLLAGDPGVVAVGPKLLFLHRYAAVRVRAAGGAAFVAAEVYGGPGAPEPLDGKVRWAPGAPAETLLALPGGGRVRGRWVTDAVVHVPAPLPGLDPAPRRGPVLRVLGREGRGPVVVEVDGGARILREAPGIVPLAPRAFPVRLVQNAGTRLTPQAEGGDAGAGEPDGSRFAREERVPALCGAALVVRRPALDRAGWFPRYYGMYYEDVDLSLRLRREGELVFCPDSLVGHYHTGTSREGSPAFREEVARSSLLFAARHAPARTLAAVLARRARQVGREVAALAPRGPAVLWREARGARGTLRALGALPGVLAERLVEPPVVDALSLPRAPRRPPGGPAEGTA